MKKSTMKAVWIVGIALVLVAVYVVFATPSVREMFTGSQPSLTLVYADWCGVCTSFKPVWDSMGSSVSVSGQTVLLKSVEEKQTTEIAPYKSMVTGYPTLIFENNGNMVKYSGPRTKEALESFIQAQLAN